MFAVVNRDGAPVIRDVTLAEAEAKKAEVDAAGYDDAPFTVMDQDHVLWWVLRRDEEGHWHDLNGD